MIEAFFETYDELGVGSLESAYQGALAVSLHERGLPVVRQPSLAVRRLAFANERKRSSASLRVHARP